MLIRQGERGRFRSDLRCGGRRRHLPSQIKEAVAKNRNYRQAQDGQDWPENFPAIELRLAKGAEQAGQQKASAGGEQQQAYPRKIARGRMPRKKDGIAHGPCKHRGESCPQPPVPGPFHDLTPRLMLSSNCLSTQVCSNQVGLQQRQSAAPDRSYLVEFALAGGFVGAPADEAGAVAKAPASEMIVAHFDDELWFQRLPFGGPVRGPAAGAARRAAGEAGRVDKSFEFFGERRLLTVFQTGTEANMMQSPVIII